MFPPCLPLPRQPEVRNNTHCEMHNFVSDILADFLHVIASSRKHSSTLELAKLLEVWMLPG